MNPEKIIPNEIESIGHCISDAINQYDTINTTVNDIPPDYHVLFILVRNITIQGVTYSVPANSTKEKIFYEAVENFKHSVENFAKHNVHVVPTVKIIGSFTMPSDTSRHYLIYEDLLSDLKKFSSVGLYDAVIAATDACGILGVTTITTFQYEDVMHGFSHCQIYPDDSSRVNQGYSMEYPHLTTTNLFIHEWMHQLEFYRGGVLNRYYPYTHGYQNPTDYGYSWDTTYFDDQSEYPHIVEATFTSFYRAVLACELTYNNGSTSRVVGMFPSYWRITPRKFVIGRYLVQDGSGDYYYNNNGQHPTSSTLSNSMEYVWTVYCSFSNGAFRVRNFSSIGNAELNENEIENSTFTRVGPYDEGQYYLVNQPPNEQILSYTNNNVLKIEDYRNNYTKTFNLEYYSELYFTLTASELTNKYLDLYNNWNNEDNTVNLGGWSGYPTAQTWQYRFNGNAYKIMPLKSPTRSLSFHNNALHITSVSNIQNWCPELISNGKYIFPGKYKIKNADPDVNQYLKIDGTNLKLSNTGTTWTIQELGDNYYSISYSNSTTTYYIYVYNGSIVKATTSSVINDTKSWKLILKDDKKFVLIPKISLNCGIASTTSGSTLSGSPTEFILIKV